MRMNFRSTLICLALFVGSAFPVKGYAGDLPGQRNTYQAPVLSSPSYAFNWAGFYAGAHLGYGFGTAMNTDINGFLGGLQAGANYQANQLVFGGEFDVSYTGIDNRGFADKFHQKWLVSGRGRFGYAIDRFMPYLTAGLAVSPSVYKNSSGNAESNHVGIVLGIGGEVMLTERISARGEWLHYRFGSENYTIANTSRNTDVITNTLRIGLNYKF